MKQLVICRSCHGHGRIYPRAGGQPIRCPDGRQLIVACTDCHATGLVPVPALEMDLKRQPSDDRSCGRWSEEQALFGPGVFEMEGADHA